ncbi:MAG: hypothetical protein QGG39_11735, partial [Candidatus Poribacteria bacterium]|nr:hypothetical protein [Candidatus Poribacteria bacterium]
KRELEEEIGYAAKKVTFFTCIHPAIGFSNVRIIKAFEHGKTPDASDDVIVYECSKLTENYRCDDRI